MGHFAGRDLSEAENAHAIKEWLAEQLGRGSSITTPSDVRRWSNGGVGRYDVVRRSNVTAIIWVPAAFLRSRGAAELRKHSGANLRGLVDLLRTGARLILMNDAGEARNVTPPTARTKKLRRGRA